MTRILFCCAQVDRHRTKLAQAVSDVSKYGVDSIIKKWQPRIATLSLQEL